MSGFEKEKENDSNRKVSTEGMNVCETAFQFLGKLKHMSSSDDYTCFDLYEGDLANDFMLLFCNSIADIPESVKQHVEKKYQTTV